MGNGVDTCFRSASCLMLEFGLTIQTFPTMRVYRSLHVIFIALASSVSSQNAVHAENAIGRLNYAGYRAQQHCTATLIGPQMGLTAAHCVMGKPAGEIHFLPGYDRGEWVEEAHLAIIDIAPAPRDIAVICLTKPAHTQPLGLAIQPPSIGEHLTVIGYPIPTMHVQAKADCTVEAAQPSGAFRLSCPVKPGASGAPVLRSVGKSYEVVGVVSAANAIQTLAFGVPSDVRADCK